MTMERSIFLIVFCIAVDAEIGKHFYVPKKLNWKDAQEYCRQYYTDLSFVNSKSETDKLLQASGQENHNGWIGLQQKPDNISAWKWSGGGNITFENWAHNQPDDVEEDRAEIHNDGRWNDLKGNVMRSFYCIDINVMEQKKSWEEALEHCRENQTDLPSMLSETDLLLAQTEIQHNRITDRVWIGLRYLGDRWLWVNGDPLVYKAWPKGGDQDHQCPVRKRCGALTKDRLWENMDCKEKLHFICI